MPRIILFYILATCAVLTFINCAKTNVESKKNEKVTEAPAPVSKMDKDMRDLEDGSMESRADYDLMGAMNDCNETFRVEMSYLEALNQSGSFPDETDKTPKCFLRCVLEMIDIKTTEGDFDPERTAMIFAGERNGTPMDGIEEISTLCAERSKIISPGEADHCERSYNYLKCVFSTEIEKYEKKS